jgi:hypothetical protein
MPRVIIGVGTGSITKAVDFEQAFSKYFKVYDFEVVSINDLVTKSGHDRARLRAKHIAFHYKDLATFFVGIAAEKVKDQIIVYASSVNADGEEGGCLQWTRSLSTEEGGQKAEVAVQASTDVAKQLAIWLNFVKPQAVEEKTV